MFLFLCFVNFCVLDYVVWWSVFVICTFVFIFFGKNLNFSYMINYYVIQEICGYYFLLFNSWKLQFLILLMKSGSAPLHFWLYSVIVGFKKWFVLWFLTFQKLPYFFVLINFCGDFSFLFLLLGVIFCYFQLFYLRGFLEIVVICSTESFNWLLFYSMFSFNEVLIFFLFYYFSMFLIISYFYNTNHSDFVSLEMFLIFLNVPLSITFFLKIFLFFGFFDVGIYYFFLLFFMVLMSIGLTYLFFLVSMVSYNFGLKFYDYLLFVLFGFGLLSVY